MCSLSSLNCRPYPVLDGCQHRTCVIEFLSGGLFHLLSFVMRKRGTSNWARRRSIIVLICYSLGRAKNSLLLPIGCRSGSTSENGWLLWRFSQVYRVRHHGLYFHRTFFFEMSKDFWFWWSVRQCSFPKDSVVISQSRTGHLFGHGQSTWTVVNTRDVSRLDDSRSCDRKEERWQISRRISRWKYQRSNYVASPSTDLPLFHGRSIFPSSSWPSTVVLVTTRNNGLSDRTRWNRRTSSNSARTFRCGENRQSRMRKPSMLWF